MNKIAPVLLNKEAFLKFGDVIEVANNEPILINSGNCARYTNLASLDICSSGVTGISLFDAKPYSNPHTIHQMERHPLGSQAFLPTSNDPFLVVVAEDAVEGAQQPRVFITDGSQGVNYHRNIWHSVLTPVVKQSLFFVIDYVGTGDNLEEFQFETPYVIDFGAALSDQS